VPSASDVKVDPKTGVLQRSASDSKLNPYDEYALETAMRIKEQTAGSVTAITMGAPFSKDILKESFGFGVDQAILLTDIVFAGADVLATSFALSEAILAVGTFDLIICGRQTTDGDTAQVGPALAECLNIPHVSWVNNVLHIEDSEISVEQDMGSFIADATIKLPCLITVEKGIYRPRLPSYIRKRKFRDHPITKLSLSDLADKDPQRYGLTGSPTQVEKLFPPEISEVALQFVGNNERVASQIFDSLKNLKLLQENL